MKDSFLNFICTAVCNRRFFTTLCSLAILTFIYADVWSQKSWVNPLTSEQIAEIQYAMANPVRSDNTMLAENSLTDDFTACLEESVDSQEDAYVYADEQKVKLSDLTMLVCQEALNTMWQEIWADGVMTFQEQERLQNAIEEADRLYNLSLEQDNLPAQIPSSKASF